MKKVGLFLVALLLLLLTACDFTLVEPVHKDSAAIVANDGTNFSVYRQEDNFPDQEIYISVSVEGNRIFQSVGIANHLSYYDYSNDIVENYSEIINEYHTDEMDIYQFNWGIIYSFDNGTTFDGVAKHNYKNKNADDSQLVQVLEFVGVEK